MFGRWEKAWKWRKTDGLFFHFKKTDPPPKSNKPSNQIPKLSPPFPRFLTENPTKTTKNTQTRTNSRTKTHSREISSDQNTKKREESSYQRVTLTGLERQTLLVHGLRVELRKRVGSTAEGGIHGAINFVEARSVRFPLLRHGNRNPRRFRRGLFYLELAWVAEVAMCWWGFYGLRLGKLVIKQQCIQWLVLHVSCHVTCLFGFSYLCCADVASVSIKFLFTLLYKFGQSYGTPTAITFPMVSPYR